MAVTRAQFEALMKRLTPQMQRQYFLAVRSAKGRANMTQLTQLITRGAPIDDVVLAAGIREGMYSTLTETMRSGFLEAGQMVLGADLPARYAVEFNINNPRAQAWLAQRSSALVTNLMDGQREAIQTMLANGLALGNNPRTTALDIVGRVGANGQRAGGVIGLTGPQAGYVTNMSSELRNLDSNYFTRTLRDKRFDSVVRKSIETGKPLNAAQRNRIVERYEARMLKHRGDTIARTETLASVNQAADEALNQVIDEGLAPKNAAKRIWRHSFAGNEREGHLRMNGQERGVDEPFQNPITGVPLQHPGAGPGSETINCRCWVEHRIDFKAVEEARFGAPSPPTVPPKRQPTPKPKPTPRKKVTKRTPAKKKAPVKRAPKMTEAELRDAIIAESRFAQVHRGGRATRTWESFKDDAAREKWVLQRRAERAEFMKNASVPQEFKFAGKGDPLTNTDVKKVMEQLKELSPKEAAKMEQFIQQYRMGTIVTRTEVNHSSTLVRAYDDYVGKEKLGKPKADWLPSSLPKKAGWVNGSPNVGGWTSEALNSVVVRMKARDGFTAGMQSLKMWQRQVSTYIRNMADSRVRGLGKTWHVATLAERWNGTQDIGTWIHEIGHQIHYRAMQVNKRWSRNGPLTHVWQQSLTEYGETNFLEFFAEHFSLWVLDRETLAKSYPRIAKLIDDLVEDALK